MMIVCTELLASSVYYSHTSVYLYCMTLSEQDSCMNGGYVKMDTEIVISGIFFVIILIFAIQSFRSMECNKFNIILLIHFKYRI
jgi:hypothetical protein